MRSPIPSPLKQLATSLLLSLFRATRATKRGGEKVLQIIWKGLAPVGRIVLHWIILPIYRIFLEGKIKFQRYLIPTRGFVLFFVSGRYLFHAALGAAAILTVIGNLQTRQARAQDIGQNSLLYALVTHQDVEIIKETAESQPPGTSNYLASTDAIVSIPHIDFDYDIETDSEPVTTGQVPGAITAPISIETQPPTQQKDRTPRTQTETYTVKEGDTIGSIAQDFGVNVGTILWSNNITDRQYIRPGDTLKIPAISGILVTVKKGDTLAKIADRYNGDADEIRSFNNLKSDALAQGEEIMVPGGSPPSPEQTLIAITGRSKEEKQAPKQTKPKSSVIGEVPIGQKIPSIKDTPIIKSIEVPSVEVKKPENVDTANVPSARFVWPTSGHVITQYYGWKHTGVDIDGDFTSPLIASYDGVVEKAGWNNGGYGLQVLIRHPNGMVTRYAHASKLFVKEGDAVKRGEVIAMMGSTGYSTGSHLHFEVYVNGARANPLAYVKK